MHAGIISVAPADLGRHGPAGSRRPGAWGASALRRAAGILVAGALVAVPLALPSAAPADAGIHPSDSEQTYKEYWLPHDESWTGGCAEHGLLNRSGRSHFLEPGPCTKTITFTLPDNVQRALRAEIYLDLWRSAYLDRFGPFLQYRINSGPTRLANAGSDFSRAKWIAPIPLAELRQGRNQMVISSNPVQARGHIHDVAFRVYTDANHPIVPGPGSDVTAPTNVRVTGVSAGGRALTPTSGGRLDVSTNALRLDASADGARWVEFHWFGEGYDEDADGVTRDWHMTNRMNFWPGGNPLGVRPPGHGGIIDHVGTDAAAPWSVSWDLATVTNQTGVRFKVRAVDAAGNVRESTATAPFELARTYGVRAYRIAGFDDIPLFIAGTQPTSATRQLNLPGISGVRAAYLVGSYWQNPFVSMNGRPAVRAFAPGEDVWALSVRSVPVTSLRAGANSITWSYNPTQIPFGQFVEKPGPMLVLHGGTP